MTRVILFLLAAILFGSLMNMAIDNSEKDIPPARECTEVCELPVVPPERKPPHYGSCSGSYIGMDGKLRFGVGFGYCL